MKKVFITRLIGLLALLVNLPVYAYDFESGGIYYNINGDNVSVTSGDSKYQGEVIIPSQVAYNGKIYKVSSIGESAFRYCKNLTSVTIPSSITSIDGEAFSSCRSLTSVTIPNSVISIGSRAFADCTGLTSLTIPNSVTSIEYGAFSLCSGLTSVAIPNSVKSLGMAAFSGCSGLTSMTIGNNITEIGYQTFRSCTGLTSVTIPSNVKAIGQEAFANCSGLTSLTMDKSVSEIGYQAFLSCTSLTSLTIPSNVISIGKEAFADCSGLTSIKVESDNNNYDSRNNCNAIIEKATNTLIVGCKNTIIPNSVMSIGHYAFRGCSGITSVTIPNSVTSIGSGAFSLCISLTSVTIPNSVSSIGESAFAGCSGLTTVTIPNSVTSIYYGTFSGCSALASITIPNSVTSIGANAFIRCKNLTSIAIPNSVISIGQSAFDETAWYGNQPEGLVYTGKILYKYKGEMPANTHIIIKDGTIGIVECAFAECSGLTSVSIPNSVTSIGYGTFVSCNSLTSITIPNGVTSIGSRAFSECRGLTSVTIPNSVESIGWSAFYGCSGLTSVTIPNSVTSIGHGAFYYCSGLTSITIPNSVTSIGENAFRGTPWYDNQPDGLVYAGKVAYSYKGEMPANTYITIKDGTLGIASNAFLGCSGLTSVTIPNSVTSVGVAAFQSCGLKTVVSEIKKPFELDVYVFQSSPSDVSDAELIVPKGTKALYQSTEGWNKFTKITESTNGGDGIKVELEALSFSREYGEANPAFDYKVNVKEGEQFLWNGLEAYGESWSLRNIDITTGMGMFNSGDRLRLYATNIGVNAWITVVIGDTKPYFVDGTFPTDGSSYLEVVLDEEKASQLNSHVSGGKITFQIQGRNFTLERISRSMSFKQNGEPTISCEATVSSPVGTYPIKISKGSISNDNVTYVDGTLTITKAPLTISAKNCSKEQGQENPVFEVTYSGFKNGETEAVLTRKPTVSTTATASSPSGTYDIEVSGAEAQNYSFIYNKGVLTVTEKDEVAFAIDGTTYQGTKSEKTVMVKAVDTSRTWMEIPASVSYDGMTYQVTGIADGVFDGSSMAALIWNVESALTNSAFNNTSIGSNFLLYVKSSSYALSSVKNVVVDGTAQKIVLSDDGGQFYCPQAFTARSISYTHNYSMETGIGKAKGWETIALPFDVQKISHNTRREIVPFPAYNSSSNQKPFWLANFSGSGFRRTAAVLANEPYIIAMPNSSSYRNEYNLAGDVTFSADNVQVPKTPSFSGTFVPAFGTVPQSSTVYALNVNNRHVKYSGNYDAGSRFIANLRDVRPFEAYISNSSTRGIIEINFDDGTTDMFDILLPTDENQEVTIHTLSGQQITRITQRDFDAVWQQLPKGVYIINGKKWIK